jgi:5-methylthioadenosine/S-adenosylhomocysteine deaminase
MQRCDTLIEAGWCIPVEPHEVVLPNHAVVINDGRIIDLLPTADATARYEPGVLVQRPDHILIPGLINAHTHAAMSLLRGFADDMPLEPWLNEAIWPLENKFVSAEMVRDGTRLAIAEMLQSGCTCFSDQYFFPEIVAETAVEMHVRAMVGTPIIEFPTAWAGGAAECMSKAADLVHDPFADHALISSCFAPHSTATVSDESFTALRVLADQLDTRIQIHLHESAQEIDNELATFGKRPVERLQSLGLINSSLMAVHAVHVTNEEIALFADSGVVVAHCPRSNLKLADGIAPVADYLQAGVTVALGTDGAASNNVLDMLGEMRTASLLAKAKAADATALPAAQALRMATLEGAKALGLANEIGSIETGKWADLTCIDLRHLNSQPVYDPLSQLVYTVQPHQVSDVWVAGRHQVDQGTLSHIDVDDLLQRTAEWQSKIEHERPGIPA